MDIAEDGEWRMVGCDSDLEFNRVKLESRPNNGMHGSALPVMPDVLTHAIVIQV
jgi:hypothetical protein